MKLTPLDVRKQEFGRHMRGYDIDEVSSFLEAVADEYEAALSEKNSLKKQVDGLERKLREYQQVEANLQDAAMNAQRAAKEAEVESSKHSKLLVQEARLEAEQVIAESRRKRQILLDDIARLEGQRRAFILKMKQILRGQVELLELLEEETLSDSLKNTDPTRTGEGKSQRTR
ncbi:MAG: Septum site-determining protein DivIVA [Calditrichaeota bacterium]|nr:Septum site-determining protein DivIVA [Calditrichota bacterium]